MSGRTLYQYEGKIPKSGTKLFRFGTEQYFHRSVAKENLLIHVATRVIIGSYPRGLERTAIIESMARNMSKLKHFIGYPRSFTLIERDKVVVEVIEVASEQSIGVSMNHYSDGSCCVPRQQEEVSKNLGKKVYDLTVKGIW